MGIVYVARSAGLSQWASDVGLSKFVFRVGLADAPPKARVESADWAGEVDWRLVKAEPAPDELTENQLIERLGAKATMVDPTYYPRLKGLRGIFKVTPTAVRNHLLARQALAGEVMRIDQVKPKPADFADYLIRNALR